MGREGRKGRGRQGRVRDGKGGQGRGPPIFYCTSQFQFSRNMPGTCSARDKIMSPPPGDARNINSWGVTHFH